ncbi:hypothetical protein DBA29_10015 [Xenophilus aerolatus]|nr:hypothetical protein [Xenophilus aerolatus]
MTATSVTPSRRAIPRLLAAMVLGAAATLASAQGSVAAEKARCDGVQQDKAACQREAGAARQEAQRGGLTSASGATYDQNALARCQLQPAADRADCEARVRGSGTSSTQGTVMGGGVIRETVTPTPAK